VFAEELVVLDAASPLWKKASPLLDAALKLEQCDENYSWRGWNKQLISSFLAGLPQKCSLVVGVWETALADDDAMEHEALVLGVVCEVVAGEVQTIRTFDALNEAGLKISGSLEPGIDDAREIMRAARMQVAPVAWALFIDKTTWDEWLFAITGEGGVVNKGEALAEFARQGRCVIMGSQTAYHHLS
jgi:hypothetical protein